VERGQRESNNRLLSNSFTARICTCSSFCGLGVERAIASAKVLDRVRRSYSSEERLLSLSIGEGQSSPMMSVQQKRGDMGDEERRR
jgi:hypothetical protein